MWNNGKKKPPSSATGWLHVGYNNFVPCSSIVGIFDPHSSSFRRFKERAEKEGKLLDASCGRKKRSLIVLQSGYVVLSALTTTTLIERLEQDEKQKALFYEIEYKEGELYS